MNNSQYFTVGQAARALSPPYANGSIDDAVGGSREEQDDKTQYALSFDVQGGSPLHAAKSLDDDLYYSVPVKPYVQGDPHFKGKIVKADNYFPSWLWGLAFFADDAGRKITEFNPHGDSYQISVSIEHEGGQDGHHGKGERNERYTTDFNNQKMIYGRSGASISLSYTHEQP